MTETLTATMNGSATAPALPQAIEIKRPSVLSSAFSFLDKDMYRLNDLLAQMAEKMEEQGVRFSKLDIQRDEERKGKFLVKMGLFDEQGRQATLEMKTGASSDPYRSSRGFTIQSDLSVPGKTGDQIFLFDGGDERKQPAHWARDPDERFRYFDRIQNDSIPYYQAFDETRYHSGLAMHLADKTLKGFKCETDPEGYSADRKAENDAYRARTNINTRKHYRPGEQRP